jgi:hypothetical protein
MARRRGVPDLRHHATSGVGHADANGRTEAEQGVFRAKADELAEPWCMTGAQLLRTFEPTLRGAAGLVGVTHVAGQTFTGGDDPWGGREPSDPFGGDDEARIAAWNSAPPAGWHPPRFESCPIRARYVQLSNLLRSRCTLLKLMAYLQANTFCVMPAWWSSTSCRQVCSSSRSLMAHHRRRRLGRGGLGAFAPASNPLIISWS